jgi:FAD/FMN-containing dehydrogenase/Fe-S oxidoreductase
MVNLKQYFSELTTSFSGDLYYDSTMRTLYATDASAYREMPLAVAIPKSVADLKSLIDFANKHNTSLIPRTAGTSLAGQVVGNGIVVDVSKHFNQILEVNKAESFVRVQPGVVRDVLNIELKKHQLFFGPETSTANRAMIGGMVGNNSCGSNSVVYGSTREHVMELKALLADGSEVVFGPKDLNNLGVGGFEESIYTKTFKILNSKENQSEIEAQFPKASIERRNTGYALDMLLRCQPFNPAGAPFNMCQLIAGSEGTLCLITEIKLHVDPAPPSITALVCAHFNTVDESLRANLIALKYKPSASELMDHYILECTKANKEQSQNRFFVQGDPGAILVVEFKSENEAELQQIATDMEAEMRAAGLGYHFPVVTGADTKKVWDLRRAGLGLLSNLPGDDKAVAVIEDTAVDVNDLPDFIREFNEILAANNMYSVHYAHAGSGEIHLRPIINLKTAEGHKQFRLIAEEIATLVKKYKGSLSGEHGDGRLRGEFIKQMVGEHNYQLMKQVKQIWDPKGIFNPGKIVDTPPMDTFLRYEADKTSTLPQTVFRYNGQNILQHAEQCNGSGDCRKTPASGGTMCPSFMATRNEKETTRARANILREYLTNGLDSNGKPLAQASTNAHEVKEVLDLCLMCKGCKTECPSNVDMAKLKMEFMNNYYETHGSPLRNKLVANFASISKAFTLAPWSYNMVMDTPVLRKIANKVVGFHPDRTMPLLAKTTFSKWFKNFSQTGTLSKKVHLFVDEFTEYNDVSIGQKAVKLFNALGYLVIVPKHSTSARPQLSKSMLQKAKAIANENVSLLKDVITEEIPLVGIEPSALLTFRDEYPDLVDAHLADAAAALSKNCYLVEEFLSKELDAKRIDKSVFTTEKRLIKLHGHCQQKALTNMATAKKTLSMPQNYEVQLIPSGCCGMCGSFGYEKEHYDISNQIAELVLLPTVCAQGSDVKIAASGTSCRHQIHDGTGREAQHAVEILFDALV